MQNKKDLAKIALTALILASATPVNGQVSMEVETQGIVLAAGCPAHGCAHASDPTNYPSTVSDQNSRTNYGSMPNASENRMSDFNRGNAANANYDNHSATEKASSTTITEAQLLGMLSPQGKAIYLSLDPEAKALAIQLASQVSYRDKNLAVKEAQRRLNERQNFNR